MKYIIATQNIRQKTQNYYLKYLVMSYMRGSTVCYNLLPTFIINRLSLYTGEG